MERSIQSSILVEIKNLIHKFVEKDEEGNILEEKYAVNDVSLDVKKGDFIVILGHNGSGKSTLAKHINALLKPDSGTIFVNGMDTREDENVWQIRQSAGMVFQNPDNQMVAPVVEEDVGFGPENLGVLTEDIWKRVESALKSVGMIEYRKHSPSRLSGGQKQRVAIAGILAMKPDCIVLDEPTAMLDPGGRKEVLNTLHELNQTEQVTIILITHHMEEALEADRIFVMKEGKILIQGTPVEVFSQYDSIKSAGLDVPLAVEISHLLRDKGYDIPQNLLTRQELVRWLKQEFESPIREKPLKPREHRNLEQKKGQPVLSMKNVDYIYSPDSIYCKHAIRQVSLDIYQGEWIGIIGHTGSGKSTLIQHFNGLNLPTSGKIYFHGQDIVEKDYDLSSLRRKVGVVFQYPEHQLFETTVLRDVSYGPRNLGCEEQEAEKQAKQALSLVGMGEKYYELSPFSLSGGEKRRVAIAGILAMKPEVLVLDEPTAALDPRGRDEIFGILKALHEEEKLTIVLVSHSMEDMAKYAERIIVINEGEKIMDGTPADIFGQPQKLEKMGLAAPEITYLMEELKQEGLPVNTHLLTASEGAEEIATLWNGVRKS